MKANSQTPFVTDPPVFLLKDLTVRTLNDEEYSRAGELLEQEHYLGDCPEGRQLLQVVEYQGHWVALLDWGPACWKLADRETYIGWTHQQRAERLALIVQNRRFLVLGKIKPLKKSNSQTLPRIPTFMLCCWIEKPSITSEIIHFWASFLLYFARQSLKNVNEVTLDSRMS